MSDLKNMPHVTVEQVLRLRDRAIEMEDINAELYEALDSILKTWAVSGSARTKGEAALAKARGE